MNDTKIKNIKARQVLDSRANPTVEVDIFLECGAMGRGIVPSGASTGEYEALELRDGDLTTYNGKSVLNAVQSINKEIAPQLIGMDALNQTIIDRTLIELDGTKNKSRIGANAILGVSIANAWAAANSKEIPLYQYLGGINARLIPMPMVQIIGGGAHASQSTDIQDFLIIPVSSHSFQEAIEMCVKVYNGTKQVFKRLGKPVSTADEGGFWPTFESNKDGLELLVKGIETAGYEPGKDIFIALDVAASEFYNDGNYLFESKQLNSSDFLHVVEEWTKNYPILSIEDAMDQNDWKGWGRLSQKFNSKIQIIGDDLFTTNPTSIKKGIEKGIANSVLIKMNQIGTITETLEAIELTKSAGYLPVISARSGETEDITIVHLALATNAGQIKVGSVVRSERTAKWNELLRIEEALGCQGTFAGKNLFEKYSDFTN